MALLGRELVGFPEAIAWASQVEAPFRGGAFVLHNPNPLVGKFPGLDGLKTGYTAQARYCLTATAVRKGCRLISVVMGAPSSRVRSAETSRLLTRAFTQFVQVKLVDSANLPLQERVAVKGGAARDLVVAYGAPLVVSVLKDHAAQVKLENRLPAQLEAPVEAGAVVGTAVAVYDDRVIGEVPIVSLEAVRKGSFWQRLFQ
jgi:D-alanyl-D-alanine carboxypeptidase (penicillin-binding protein 5/6)